MAFFKWRNCNQRNPWEEKMFKERLDNVREQSPLIHNITNYVTVNDCANILLACGASPIMADDMEDVLDIATVCTGLNINIGTLNQRTIPSMYAAGRKANELEHPVLLDPVGAGASGIRTDTALGLLEEVQFTAIRGNISEIKTLALGSGSTRGVDASALDAVTIENIMDSVSFAKNFAKRTGTVIGITGPIDIVADSEKAYIIHNGHRMMGRITGSGCMLSAMMTAYLSANKDNPLDAAAAAVCAMGLAGEKAYERLGYRDGNSTYRNYLIDEIYHLTGKELEEGAKYEIY